MVHKTFFFCRGQHKGTPLLSRIPLSFGLYDGCIFVVVDTSHLHYYLFFVFAFGISFEALSF